MKMEIGRGIWFRVAFLVLFLLGAALVMSTSAHADSGWVFTDGSWYYLDEAGAPRTGWIKPGNYWYYLDETGAMQTGWLTVEGDGTYYLAASGKMTTGWVKLKNEWQEENWYYFDGSGRMQTGWVKYKEGWYYLDDTGVMKTGWLFPNGEETYYLAASGKMVTGWAKLDTWGESAWYYFDGSGRMQTGWVKDGDDWYYLHGIGPRDMEHGYGAMRTGYLELEDGVYFLRSSGRMYTGWIGEGDNWYYYTPSGRRALGWQWIDNDKYYFYQEDDGLGGKLATMARDTVIDGQTIKADGTWLSDSEVNMVAKAQNYTSATNYLILVDDDACKTGIFERTDGAWVLTYFWNCAPGASSTPTVHGVFTVQARGYYFVSYGSRCYYYTQFYGNYLFHSVTYDPSTGAVQDGRLGMHLSHGCVRLSLKNAKWIYDNIPQGTKVVIY